mgnify:CR=1 FL=1
MNICHIRLIESISISNFKAIDSLTINANGHNVLIEGQNGSGKSSIFDAYFWTLTGKLADGSTPNANDIINSSSRALPAVTVAFDKFSIARSLVKKGNGFETIIAINDAPVKPSELPFAINHFIPAQAIELLSNIFSFALLKKSDRRALLMQLISVSNEDVFKANATLTPLANLFHTQSIDDIIFNFKNNVKDCKLKLAQLAPRIDENLAALQSLDASVLPDLRQKLAALVEQKSIKDNEIINLRASLKSTPDPKRAVGIRRNIEHFQQKIARADEKLIALRQEFVAVRNQSGGECPTCKQPLPTALFQQIKNERLRDINRRGQELKSIRNDFSDSLLRLQSELESLPHGVDTSDIAEKIAAAERELAEINRNIDAVRSDINRLAQADNIKGRIDALKADEKSLAAALADYERILFLANEFQNTKIKLIEDAINRLFKFVSFKLFETCQNGNIKDVCEPTMHGVDFDNLSSGEKFKASLDILRTFSRHLGIKLPVFIDNSESYTTNSRFDIGHQTFILRAVDDKPLTVTISESSIQFDLICKRAG